LFKSFDLDDKECQYAYTSLFDTVFKGEDTDKYTSMDNGVCYIMVRGEQAKCSYIDRIVNDRLLGCRMQASVDVYPGANTLFLVCAANNGEHTQELPCETKNYELWKISLSDSYNNII
jgi:hypothetical protein